MTIDAPSVVTRVPMPWNVWPVCRSGATDEPVDEHVDEACKDGREPDGEHGVEAPFLPQRVREHHAQHQDLTLGEVEDTGRREDHVVPDPTSA